MKNQKNRKRIPALLLAGILLLFCGSYAIADEYYDDYYYGDDYYYDYASSDDSLSSLGISTTITSIDPEFYYSTLEYQVVVPAGTESISLDPTPSNANAHVADVSGTALDDNGQTTVSITVTAEAGNSSTYYLYVTSEDGGAALRAVEEAAAQAALEAQTEQQTEEETEAQTEDSRYVSVARETLEEAENTIDALKEETTLYRDRGNTLLRILYVLIAICVVLLFIVINLLLRNREIRSELNDFRGMDYSADQEMKEAAQEQEQIRAPEDLPEHVPEEEQDAFEEEAAPVDDPSKVPKPTDAKQQPKQMPQYEAPQKQTAYEPSKEKKEAEKEDAENNDTEKNDTEKKDGSVDVEYIDL